MQQWSLERKMAVSQTRLIEWYMKHNGKAFVSFSGGKDSTVLADLVARVCKACGYKLILWFCDTGLEYPEIREHIKIFGDYLEKQYDIEVETVIDYPRDRYGNRISFRDVIINSGYPLIGKEVAGKVASVRRTPNGKTMQRFIEGSDYHKKYGDRWLLSKYRYLIDAPFKISDQCCITMKKQPSQRFEKKTGCYKILGTMACESRLRQTHWFKNGCNAFDTKHPSSQPLSFWTEQDVLEYIVKYNIPIASVYGDIKQDKSGKYYTTGCDRTGCMYCGFGCHLEKEPNRFQKLKQTHPKIWEYCMRPIEDGGLGMKMVLDFIGVKSE